MMLKCYIELVLNKNIAVCCICVYFYVVNFMLLELSRLAYH